MRRGIVVVMAALWAVAAAQAGQAIAWPPDQARLTRTEVQAHLAKRVTFDFNAIPFEEALAQLRTRLGVKVAVDPNLDAKKQVTMKAADLPGDMALDWLARFVGAKVYVMEGFVLIAEQQPGGVAAQPGPAEGPAQPGAGAAVADNGPKAGEERIHAADGSVLVWVPGGSFLMGSNNGPEDEQPVHRVQVAGFWCGKYEVTNRQYKRFLAATRAAEYYESGYADEPAFSGDEQPVVSLTWIQARAYVTWAKLRMLTEAEWEYVASAGKQFEYPTATGQISHDLANYVGAPVGTRGGKWRDVTSPIGSFPANPFGIFDLAGNAWEHTSSTFREYPYSATDGRENLMMNTGHAGLRVMRGGCWHFGPEVCRTTYRHRIQAHLRLDFAGLRVAASQGEGKAAEGQATGGEE